MHQILPFPFPQGSPTAFEIVSDRRLLMARSLRIGISQRANDCTMADGLLWGMRRLIRWVTRRPSGFDFLSTFVFFVDYNDVDAVLLKFL